MLIADLIVDCEVVDWTAHLPLMLHIIFLGVDNSRPLIHEHCKKLLLNLLLVLSAHNDHFTVAKVILSNKSINEDSALTLPTGGGGAQSATDLHFMGKTTFVQLLGLCKFDYRQMFANYRI